MAACAITIGVGPTITINSRFGRIPAANSPPSTFAASVQTVKIGHDVIRAGGKALDYDRKVMRHVDFGEPLDLDALPTFCTEGQCHSGSVISAACEIAQ